MISLKCAVKMQTSEAPYSLYLLWMLFQDIQNNPFLSLELKQKLLHFSFSIQRNVKERLYFEHVLNKNILKRKPNEIHPFMYL